MQIKKVKIEDETEWLNLRGKYVSSTESAALLGMSPYLTKFQMYHIKKDTSLEHYKESIRMDIGKYLEPAIAELAAAKNDWKLKPLKEYWIREDLRMGSSFDYISECGKFLVEVKNVDFFRFKEVWKESLGVVEALPQIEIQAQHQLLVSGLEKIFIVALVGGSDLVVIERDRSEKIIEMIKTKTAEFWKDIEAENEPDADYSADSEFILKTLYSGVEPGKYLSVHGDEAFDGVCEDFSAASEQRKALVKHEAALKAKVQTMIEDAEISESDLFKVTNRISKNGAKRLTITKKGG